LFLGKHDIQMSISQLIADCSSIDLDL